MILKKLHSSKNYEVILAGSFLQCPGKLERKAITRKVFIKIYFTK